MRWLIAALLLAAMTTTGVPAPAAAAVGTCPDGFHRHAIGDGDHEHGEHRHVGLSLDAVDRNANGWICVAHVTPAGEIHVHIDDLAPTHSPAEPRSVAARYLM